MILGVSGSRGFVWNERRASKLYDFMVMRRVTELHHGCCTGWDAQAHFLAEMLSIKTVLHPPENGKLVEVLSGDVILPAKPYLDRNKDIVDAVDYLIAAPDGPERQRSGTWSTVRYAKKVGVPGVVWLARA